MPEDRKQFTADEWAEIADYIVSERHRRANKRCRKDKELIWREIDRQIAMDPLPRELGSGDRNDWLPNTELPLQFNTLEVNMADARRLKFPRGSEWFSASANMSDKYLERWNRRRESNPIIGKMPDGAPIPVKIDQETADTIVKASIDHFHRLYDFRSAIDMFDAEMIKYGTGIVRTKQVLIHKFLHDFRGTVSKELLGPAVIPLSIKDVYLDDSPVMVMHEGITHAPGHIRRAVKRLEDVLNAIKVGGPEKGWRQDAIAEIMKADTPEQKVDALEVLEFEGDLLVPCSSETLFLPNVIVTVAWHSRTRQVIRFRENDWPFISYDVGHYMRQDVDDPYGVSPLMKGQPLQEAATEILNDLMAAASLSARPPVFYDRMDMQLTAKGGPQIYPGSQTPTDSPNAVEFMERPDVAALTNTYLAVVKQYEDLTAVNDPRRGGPVRSHTTATAIDIEQSRGLSRTDDFVQSIEKGALTSILYKEYEIVKKSLTSATPIHVDMGGIEGWMNLSGQDLPDQVAIRVHGSQGVLNERQQMESFAAATNIVTQLAIQAAQLAQGGIAKPIDINFQRLAEEIYRRAGINNAREFLGGGAAGTAPAPAQPEAAAGLPTPLAGVPTNDVTDVARALGI